jgi:hypothetical protein
MSGLKDPQGVKGECRWTLRGPDGRIKTHGVNHNLITQVGDQVYGERGAGIAGAAAAPTGMKLGTGSTATAKTGAGAALVTYLSGSQQAFDGTYPQSSLASSSRRITYKVTYAAGTATTATPIAEAVIVNETLTNATSAASATVSRVLVSPTVVKAAGDTLTLTWTQDLLGS